MSGRQKSVTTTRTRRRKYGGNSGYIKCPKCNGTGRVKKK